MRKFPKTDSPEVLCLSSMGNEPGLQTSCRELTPAARTITQRGRQYHRQEQETPAA